MENVVINHIEKKLKENKNLKNIFVTFECENLIYNNDFLKNTIILIDNFKINIPIISIVPSVKCFNFISKNLFYNLKNCGWIVNIIENKNLLDILEIYKYYTNHYFIFLRPFSIPEQFFELRNKYIIYQFEQYNTELILSEHYKKMIGNEFFKKCFDNAKLLFDYAQINIKNIKNIFGYELIYLPPLIKSYNTIDYNKQKIYDLIFIGAMNNRRKNILY